LGGSGGGGRGGAEASTAKPRTRQVSAFIHSLSASPHVVPTCADVATAGRFSPFKPLRDDGGTHSRLTGVKDGLTDSARPRGTSRCCSSIRGDWAISTAYPGFPLHGSEPSASIIRPARSNQLR